MIAATLLRRDVPHLAEITIYHAWQDPIFQNSSAHVAEWYNSRSRHILRQVVINVVGAA